MKKLFLEVRRKVSGKEDFSILNSLEGEVISLASTIQYLDFIPLVKNYLESLGKKVLIKKGSFYEGQVIGCNPIAFDKNADKLLLIADGKFHAKNNALLLNREIFVFNLSKLESFSLEDLENEKKKIKSKKVKFLSSDKVGLIVSIKPGQNFPEISSLAKKIEKKGKEVYTFETNNINLNELENFPDLKIWINTACYGLGLDDPRIINLKDLNEFL